MAAGEFVAHPGAVATPNRYEGIGGNNPTWQQWYSGPWFQTYTAPAITPVRHAGRRMSGPYGEWITYYPEWINLGKAYAPFCKPPPPFELIVPQRAYYKGHIRLEFEQDYRDGGAVEILVNGSRRWRSEGKARKLDWTTAPLGVIDAGQRVSVEVTPTTGQPKMTAELRLRLEEKTKTLSTLSPAVTAVGPLVIPQRGYYDLDVDVAYHSYSGPSILRILVNGAIRTQVDGAARIMPWRTFPLSVLDAGDVVSLELIPIDEPTAKATIEASLYLVQPSDTLDIAPSP